MFFETLYKKASPAELEKAEYYQPLLEMLFVNGAWMFFVREKHGWFSEGKGAVNQTVTLSPEEGFVTPKEAEDRYHQQVKHRASEGFVHAFSVDQESEYSIRHRIVDPKS